LGVWGEVIPTFEVDVEKVMAKDYSLPCFEIPPTSKIKGFGKNST
jgi:hypothetical protein